MTILEELIDYIVYSTSLIVFQQFHCCFYFEQGKRVVDNIQLYIQDNEHRTYMYQEYQYKINSFKEKLH